MGFNSAFKGLMPVKEEEERIWTSRSSSCQKTSRDPGMVHWRPLANTPPGFLKRMNFLLDQWPLSALYFLAGGAGFFFTECRGRAILLEFVEENRTLWRCYLFIYWHFEDAHTQRRVRRHLIVQWKEMEGSSCDLTGVLSWHLPGEWGKSPTRAVKIVSNRADIWPCTFHYMQS